VQSRHFIAAYSRECTLRASFDLSFARNRQTTAIAIQFSEKWLRRRNARIRILLRQEVPPVLDGFFSDTVSVISGIPFLHAQLEPLAFANWFLGLM